MATNASYESCAQSIAHGLDAGFLPWTSLNRRLLASTIASVGVYAGFGASYITAATAVALGLAAIFTHRGPRDPTLTVQDRCLMNQERLCFGAVPGCGRWT